MVGEKMYISEHPILGTDVCQQTVNITVDGRPLQVKAGSMIAGGTAGKWYPA